MDSGDQAQPYMDEGGKAMEQSRQHEERYELWRQAHESAAREYAQRQYEIEQFSGRDSASQTQWQDSQTKQNEDLEGHLRSMIMHHNGEPEHHNGQPEHHNGQPEHHNGQLEYHDGVMTSTPPPHPMAGSGDDSVEHPSNEQNGHRMPPPHMQMEMSQPYPPHFVPGGYGPMPPPVFMHGPPPPGMYHMPMHPYLVPYNGQMLPYPMSAPYPMPPYLPPGYVLMPPDQIPVASFAPPMDAPDAQGNELPLFTTRQFEKNGPRHQRNYSHSRQYQKYPPRRQFDQGPPAPRINGNVFQTRQREQHQQPHQPGLINDDFPPLGTERPKAKINTPPVVPEQSYQEEMNGSRREYKSGPPAGPRYRGGPRNFGPRNQQYQTGQGRQQHQPYQLSSQELAVLAEVAKEQIALATPSAEELEHKTKLRERLQKLCSNVSPTAELKAFGSLVSGFATVGSDLDLVFVDKGVDTDRPFFEVPLLLEQELKDSGLEAMLLAKTRVPILKIKQPATDEYPREVAADIGFANSLAIKNTEMLAMYAKCDSRVVDMVRFIKRWAKQRKINNPYKGSLSSYGYVLMVLHYLINIVEPPVLPNLQLYRIPHGTAQDEITTEEGHNVWYYKDIAEIKRQISEGTMATNTMDLASLLLGFFDFYAHRFGWVKDIISIRTEGGLITKMDKGWVTAAVRVGQSETEYKDRYLIAIEDPFEINHNVSRTCTFYGVRRIRDEFRRANRIMRMREGEEALRVWLFEEAPEEVRPAKHQHRHSEAIDFANREHGEGNGAGEEGARPRSAGSMQGSGVGKGKENGVQAGEGNGVEVLVEGVRKMSV